MGGENFNTHYLKATLTQLAPCNYNVMACYSLSSCIPHSVWLFPLFSAVWEPAQHKHHASNLDKHEWVHQPRNGSNRKCACMWFRDKVRPRNRTRHPFITTRDMLYLIWTYYKSVCLVPSVCLMLLRTVVLILSASQIYKNEAALKYDTNSRFFSSYFLAFSLIN